MSRRIGFLGTLTPQSQEMGLEPCHVSPGQPRYGKRRLKRRRTGKVSPPKLRGGKVRGFPLPGLYYWRRQRGLTQAELAAKAELAFATVNRLESGQTTAYEDTVYKLAEALGVSRWALMREGTR
jgi:DNA-binding XRE family transcriptional regulator